MPFHQKPKFPKVYAAYYDELLFYDGREAWHARYLKCPENGRNLFCVHWTFLEIDNGGFWQYFHNSSGVMAPEAVVGYRAIGMPEVAAAIESAMAKLPNPYPFDREERQQAVGELDKPMNFVDEDNIFWEKTPAPRLFFSKPKYYDFADRYAYETGGL
jgi:Domain of unknown function (DUF4375)